MMFSCLIDAACWAAAVVLLLGTFWLAMVA
jgi:hypothetical protein